MKKMKSALPLMALAAFLMMGWYSTRAFAESKDGTCGDQASWALADGILTVSGTGEMETAPWYRFCDDIVTVRIEAGITSICDYAFQYCEHLTSIEIPDTVTSIGRLAFYNCSVLQSLYLPDSVTELGGGALSGCSSLCDMHLSGSLTDINASVFDRCSALTHLDVPEGVIRLKSVPGKIETINLPDSLRYFGTVFRNLKHLRSIHLPEGITTILPHAFYNCDELEEVVLPQSLEKIGEGAFSYCEKIGRIRIPAGVRYIDDLAFVLTYQNRNIVIECESGSYAEE